MPLYERSLYGWKKLLPDFIEREGSFVGDRELFQKFLLPQPDDITTIQPFCYLVVHEHNIVILGVGVIDSINETKSTFWLNRKVAPVRHHELFRLFVQAENEIPVTEDDHHYFGRI